MDEHESLKLLKVCLFLYALTEKVEAELKQLQDQGILFKVEWSEWATVPIVKENYAIRLCGDFNVTINPVLHADQYIFASVAFLLFKIKMVVIFHLQNIVLGIDGSFNPFLICCIFQVALSGFLT